jgi:hypothetical protein
MRGWAGIVAVALGVGAHGCADRPAVALVPPPPTAVAPAAAVPPPAAAVAPVAGTCTGPNERLWGTTCCEHEPDPGDARFPGQIATDCHGPQVGKPCARRGDCDIACSCDPPGELLRPGQGGQGPANGTRGVTGTCTGVIQIGVWMCRIDENGVVGHVILD